MQQDFQIKDHFFTLKAFCNGDDNKLYTNCMEVTKTQQFANSIINSKW